MKRRNNVMSGILCAMIVVLMATFAACGSVQEDANSTGSANTVTVQDDSNLGFETIYSMYENAHVGVNEYDINEESGVWVYYLREKLTNTMYVWRTTARESNPGGYSYWSSGMTVLMDPATNGPMTYEAFQQYLNSQEDGNG